MDIESLQKSINKIKEAKIKLGAELDFLNKEKDKLKLKLEHFGLKDSTELVSKLNQMRETKTNLENNIMKNLSSVNSILNNGNKPVW